MKTNTLLDQMRYTPERKLLEDVFERFELEPIVANFEANRLPSFREMMLATKLKLTKLLSPRLFSLLEEVSATLEFTLPVELFVSAGADVNAYAVYSVDETPHIIGLTSSLVERLSDTELRFVLGHEIGHLQYRHYRAKILDVAFGDAEMPALLKRRLATWSRLAELSADRAGFAAAQGELQSIVSVFFKIESGLGPEHVKFDIAAFLNQLSELQQSDRSSIISHFSHPLTPIRVRALQLFGEVGPQSDKLAAVDAAVKSLAEIMERVTNNPIEMHGRDFILAAGVLVAHADGQGMSDDEHTLLVDMLLPLTADPEADIPTIASGEQAMAVMTQSADWLNQNAGEERFTIFRLLAKIATTDGALKGKEEETLLAVGRMLEIPEAAGKKAIYETLTSNLQAKRTTKFTPTGDFNFKTTS